MRTPSLNIVLITLVLLPLPSQAGSWYSALTYTRSDAELLSGGSGSLGTAPVSISIEEENRDNGWQLTAGYKYSSNLTLELGWVDYGTHTATVSLVPTVLALPNVSPFIDPGSVNFGTFFNDGNSGNVPRPIFTANAIAAIPPFSKLETNTQGLRIAANGLLPLTEKFSLSLQGGGIFTKYENTITTLSTRIEFDPVADPPFVQIEEISRISETSRDMELFGGFGAQYSFTDHLAAKLFWERIFNLGDGDTLEQDLDSYNLSLIVSF